MAENKSSIVFPEGTCTKICLDFLRFKHSLGQKFEGSDIYRLRYICQQMNEAVGDTPVLSKDTVLNIAQCRDGEAQGTQLNRIRILRQLAEYMVSVDMEAYILPGHFTQKYRYDFRPYIFSREQIADILDAADRMEYSLRSPYMHVVMPAILRVFFGCGLRSSEARQLKLCNVDLTAGVLTVKKSKNLVSRYVPMAESLTTYLHKYADTMGFSFNTDNDAYFFPSPSGGVIHETTLRDRFHAILLQASGVSVKSLFALLNLFCIPLKPLRCSCRFSDRKNGGKRSTHAAWSLLGHCAGLLCFYRLWPASLVSRHDSPSLCSACLKKHPCFFTEPSHSKPESITESCKHLRVALETSTLTPSICPLLVPVDGRKSITYTLLPSLREGLGMRVDLIQPKPNPRQSLDAMCRMKVTGMNARQDRLSADGANTVLPFLRLSSNRKHRLIIHSKKEYARPAMRTSLGCRELGDSNSLQKAAKLLKRKI